MTIDSLRLRQRQQQQTAIDSRRTTEGISRIGDRDPETGRYQVISPDGSTSRDGIKVFTADAPGTPVLATDRTDRIKVLDSLKPTDRPYFPEPLSTPPLYREGRVFEIPELKKSTKGPIHILFSDQGKLWVGGHQDDPEEVIVPTWTGITTPPALWADRAGWVFSQREILYPNVPNLKIYSYNSDGEAYSSPATPDGKLIVSSGLLDGNVGFGHFAMRDKSSPGNNQTIFQGYATSYLWSRGLWTFVNAPYQSPNQSWNYSVNLPLAVFENTVVSRINEFADVDFDNNGDAYDKVWTCLYRDRDSAILSFSSKDYMSGIFSGYYELVKNTGTPQQLYPWSRNIINNTGTQNQGVPFGMYTDGQFTNITSTLPQLNNLKSGPGLITIATTTLARITTTEQVIATKIPATANIITYCTTLS